MIILDCPIIQIVDRDAFGVQKRVGQPQWPLHCSLFQHSTFLQKLHFIYARLVKSFAPQNCMRNEIMVSNKEITVSFPYGILILTQSKQINFIANWFTGVMQVVVGSHFLKRNNVRCMCIFTVFTAYCHPRYKKLYRIVLSLSPNPRHSAASYIIFLANPSMNISLMLLILILKIGMWAIKKAVILKLNS